MNFSKDVNTYNNTAYTSTHMISLKNYGENQNDRKKAPDSLLSGAIHQAKPELMI